MWHAVEFLTIHFNYFLRMWEGEGRADCAVLYFFSSAGKRGMGGGRRWGFSFAFDFCDMATKAACLVKYDDAFLLSHLSLN